MSIKQSIQQYIARRRMEKLADALRTRMENINAEWAHAACNGCTPEQYETLHQAYAQASRRYHRAWMTLHFG